MKVSIVSVTTPRVSGINSAEELVVYTARVSNPSNQLNTETAPRLLAYLIKHKHWSPFEMVSVTLEIETSRAIAAQILRHRSFSFQEFSQRYAEIPAAFEEAEFRRQGEKNRQSSEEPLSGDVIDELCGRVGDLEWVAGKLYKDLLHAGVAREVARFVLPLSVKTRLYMSGTLRSWIHYFEARCSPETQKEHRDIALAARALLKVEFPNVAAALEW